MKRIASALALLVGLTVACSRPPEVRSSSLRLDAEMADGSFLGPEGSKITTGFSVEAGEIYRQGELIHLKGLNWFGLDTTKHSLHGLWTGRTIDSFLKQVKELGFNALRIPVSPESLSLSTPGEDGFASPTEEIKTLLRFSEQEKIYILFDIHTCSSAQGHTTGTPNHCPNYSKDQWFRDLRTMAELAKQSSYVVGIDLYNEPYKLTWEQWAVLAEEGAQNVLGVNSDILVFVEGVADASFSGKHAAFWGENLYNVRTRPLNIPRNKLVYSPHTYGPSVYGEHAYFNDPTFPANMTEVWDDHFGYLLELGYPLAVGEFGGKLQGKDAIWQEAFVNYLHQRKIKHFFYWSLNPNSGDTGGLLLDDWQSVDQQKHQLLQKLLQR